MQEIYLIRHSAPFVELDNADQPWDEINRNMVLSVKGEKNAEKLCHLKELKNPDQIYSSNSVRAISTSKYLAEKYNKKIIVDNRINERNFGIKYLKELPKDFTSNQFKDYDLKLKNGESYNEVNKRFSEFIKDILKLNNKKTVLFVHGVNLLVYLSNYCTVKYANKKFTVKYNNHTLMNGSLKNPHIFKLTFENKQIVNIENLS